MHPWQSPVLHQSRSSASYDSEATNLVLTHYRSGTCRKQWKKMTEMNPRQLRVKDPIKKERRKHQAIQAFEAYQQRQMQISPSTNHPHSKQTPNALTVPTLSEVATPADSMAETQTPQYFSHPIVSLDICQDIIDASATPEQAQSPARTFIPDSERKQPSPFEFGLAISTSTRNPIFHLNPSKGPENMSAQANEAPASHTKTTMVQELRADGHHVVESESVVKERFTALAKIEDEMSVPRGFIDFFKYQLTITRNSVASALSSPGPIRLPWSRKRSRQIQSDGPQTSHEAGVECVSLQPPSGVQAGHQWTQISPPMETDGRANTDLFWELQLAGSTDEEIASRLEALINAGANPNARSFDGETPLHVALRLGNLPACQVLLDRGADVHVRTLDGKSFSEYGKIAQNCAGNNSSRYLAIKTCRHAINEYDPHQKAPAASKLAPKTIAPLAGQKHAREQDGGMSGGSRTKAPPESILEMLEGSQPLHTRDPGFLTCGEGPSGAMPSDGPFPNTNFNGGNTNARAMTARNSEDNESTTSSFNPDLHSTSDMPPIPFLDRIPSHPLRRSPLSVQKLVEQFDGRQSAKWSSVLPYVRSNNLDGRHDQESSLAYSYSSTQNLHVAVSQIPNTRPSGYDNTSRYRHASHALNGQSNIPINPQQSLSSPRHNVGLPLEPVSDSASPIRLSGYLTTLPTGQMALVCPLSPNTTWQYVAQELNGNDYSPAAVRIISPPSTTVQHAYTAGTRAPSTPVMSQGQTVQTATMTATPAWADVEPHVQPQPTSLGSDFMNNNVRRQYALNNYYVDGWDYSRPGFNS